MNKLGWKLLAVELLGRQSQRKRKLRSRRLAGQCFPALRGHSASAEEPEAEEEDEGEDEDEPEEPPAKKAQPACSSCGAPLVPCWPEAKALPTRGAVVAKVGSPGSGEHPLVAKGFEMRPARWTKAKAKAKAKAKGKAKAKAKAQTSLLELAGPGFREDPESARLFLAAVA